MSKYKWIPNSTACSTCVAMASEVYSSPPQRPHKYCQCSYSTVTRTQSNSAAGMIPRILSINMVSSNVQHDPSNSGDLWNKVESEGRAEYKGEGTFEFTAQVLCPNGNEVTVNVTVTAEDGEFYDVQSRAMNMRVEDGKNAEGKIENPDPLLDDISEAMDDYNWGLEFKATQKVQQLINSGGGPCS